MRYLLLLASLLIALPAGSAEKRADADAPWVALHLLGFQNDSDLESIDMYAHVVKKRGLQMATGSSTPRATTTASGGLRDLIRPARPLGGVGGRGDFTST